MHSMALAGDRDKIVVGVDTHKYVHVAVAINSLGVYRRPRTGTRTHREVRSSSPTRSPMPTTR